MLKLNAFAASNTIMGLAISLILRQIYKNIRIRFNPSLLSIGFIILVCSSLITLFWNFLTVEFHYRFETISPEVIARLPFTIEEFIYVMGMPFRTMALVTWSAIYFGVHYLDDFQKEHERRLDSKSNELKAKVSMLKSQLNPHFLFNILNSINALISENKTAAKKLIADLSDFLRIVTQNPMREQITIQEEMKMVHTYLNLQKVRFEDKFLTEVIIDKNIESMLIPSFILNPLVENAIKYGMETSEYPVKIKIIGEAKENGFILTVSNSGHWVEEKKINKDKISVGLDNVKKQLESLYPDKHKFNQYEKDGFVSVEMEISS